MSEVGENTLEERTWISLREVSPEVDAILISICGLEDYSNIKVLHAATAIRADGAGVGIPLDLTIKVFHYVNLEHLPEDLVDRILNVPGYENAKRFKEFVEESSDGI